MHTPPRPRGSARRRTLIGACAVTALVGACGSGPDLGRGTDPLVEASSVATLPSNVGPADCQPPSTINRLPNGSLEIRGATLPGTELWALAVGVTPPLPADQPIRVLWRINGAHGLRLVMVDAAGAATPVQGVHPDPAARWQRPGDAWKSTLTFPQAGCWRISATRGGRHGDVWVQVG